MVALFPRCARILTRGLRPAPAHLRGAHLALLGAALSVSLMLFAPVSAWSQAAGVDALPGGYPARPLTLVCPFAPGGSADIMARLLAQKLSDQTGKPVVVENRPGAGGMVGAAIVARAKPDGYTMLLVTGAYPAAAALTAKPAFDPVKDMTMVSMVTSYPFIMNVPAQSPFTSFADLLAHAKRNPGVLNYASSGVGSIGHLTVELMNAMAGIETVHIPTRGGTTALSETLAGRIDFLFEAPTLSLPFIKSGKLRALAATSRERYPVMPELATVAESLPGYEVVSFIALGVTGGTPDPIVRYLNAQVRAVLSQPDMSRRLLDLGGEPQGGSVEDINRFVAHELRKWQQVIDGRKIERQ